MRLQILFLIIAAQTPVAGQTTLHHKNEWVEFDYPAGWQLRERVSQSQIAIELWKSDRPDAIQFLAVRADIGDERSLHDARISMYLKESSGWVRNGESTLQRRPTGRDRTTLLASSSGERQAVTTIKAAGAFLLFAGPLHPDSASMRETVLNSLSLGAPGKLRLDRPDKTANATDLLGVWQDRGSTLRFRSDGTATSEVHLPGRRSQAFFEARQGTFLVDGGRLRLYWRRSEVLPAREESCVFRRAGSALRLMCDEWGDEATYVPLPAAERSDISGLLLNVVLSAAAIAILLSLVMIAIFRGAVRRLMNRPSTSANDGAQFDTVASSGTTPAVAPGRMWQSEAIVRRNRLMTVYALAGSAAAALLATGAAVEYSGGVSVARLLSLFLVAVWPVLLIANELFGYGWKRCAEYASVYAGLLLATGVILHLLNSDFAIWHIGLLWVLQNGGPTLLIYVFANKAIRTVGPVILSAALVVMAGMWGFQHAVATNIRVGWMISRVTGFLSPETGAASPFLIGLLTTAPVAYVVLRILARAYEKQRISDQSLTVDSIMFTFVLLQGIVTLGDGKVGAGLLWVACAFPVYLVVKVVASDLVGVHSDSRAAFPSLLYLRVFRGDRDARRMFDSVSGLWRFVGPVRLIGGEDLASRLIQPSTLLRFAGGQISALFIESMEKLRYRLSQLKAVPDVDGRFRTHEFFCYSNTWLPTVSQLAQRSEAILMDVRSLKDRGRRGGVEHEIHELLRTVPAKKIALLVDGRTDREHLAKVEREAWQSLDLLSPNYNAPDRSLRRIVLRNSSSREIDRACKAVFEVLSDAEEPGRTSEVTASGNDATHG